MVPKIHIFYFGYFLRFGFNNEVFGVCYVFETLRNSAKRSATEHYLHQTEHYLYATEHYCVAI